MEQEKSNIRMLIKACKEGNRTGQKKLYQLFFSYGMSVAIRYAGDQAEAEDVFNEAFFKVFKKIDQFDESKNFKAWFRRIVIHTSIDYNRKYKKLKPYALEEGLVGDTDKNFGWDNLLYEDILKHIQKLPPSYRIVFNMRAIEGFKHREIAEQLGISEGSSKSSYSKARSLLQIALKKNDKLRLYKHG